MTVEEKIDVVQELKRLSRRIEDLDKSIARISTDREILEDLLSRMSKVEMALHLNREKQTENAKNIKEDIEEVRDAVTAKVGEVATHIEDKTVLVKATKESIIQRIIKALNGGR